MEKCNKCLHYSRLLCLECSCPFSMCWKKIRLFRSFPNGSKQKWCWKVFNYFMLRRLLYSFLCSLFFVLFLDFNQLLGIIRYHISSMKRNTPYSIVEEVTIFSLYQMRNTWSIYKLNIYHSLCRIHWNRLSFSSHTPSPTLYAFPKLRRHNPLAICWISFAYEIVKSSIKVKTNSPLKKNKLLNLLQHYISIIAIYHHRHTPP